MSGKIFIEFDRSSYFTNQGSIQVLGSSNQVLKSLNASDPLLEWNIGSPIFTNVEFKSDFSSLELFIDKQIEAADSTLIIFIDQNNILSRLNSNSPNIAYN